ncbi:MAG: TolC family protein [Deltaproteobacteria bacterium]|nr:TolC family protein [Deltaproteobacteria bacterium]
MTTRLVRTSGPTTRPVRPTNNQQLPLPPLCVSASLRENFPIPFLPLLLSACFALLSASAAAQPSSETPTPPVEAETIPPVAPPPAEIPPPAAAEPAVWDLDACLRRAFELRPELRDADAGVAVVQAGVDQAEAGYYPAATASAGYQRVQRGTSGPGGDNSFSLGLTATWSATDLAWVPTEVHTAEALTDAAVASSQVTRRAIRLQVVVAYHTLWGARRVAALTHETLEAVRIHREYALARQEIGTGAAADVARADVEIADAALLVASADAAVQTARASLARAIGLPADAAIEIPDVEPEPGAVPEGLPDGPERPEVVALRRQAESARTQADAASAGYWPDLSFSASAGLQDNDFFPTQEVWSIGAAVQFPIFSWSMVAPAVDAAEARAEQYEARVETTRDDIELELESARFALDEARARLDACGPLLASAAENLRVAEGLYQEGSGSMIELVDARAAILRAQITRIQAVRDLAVAAARLRYAAGEEP